MANKEFKEWVVKGLDEGYVQELDKHFREQYGIEQECTDQQWEDAKEYFSKN